MARTRPVRAIFFYFFLLFIFFLTTPAQAADDPVSVVSRKKTWHKLLHYSDGLLGEKSRADGSKFFYSEKGNKDPEAELRATLKAFQSSGETDDRHPICRFPARFIWLSGQLPGELQNVNKPSCPKFEEFRNEFKAKSMTLIYTSSFMDHPASLFGHTHLKFNRKDPADPEAREDKVVNYAARVPPIDPFRYIPYAIFGMFKGSFEVTPYYTKIYEYNEYENRNLWEFELTLTQAEVEFIIAHIWEMSQTHFDYYFFDENCTYMLLVLIETVRTDANMSDSIILLQAPAEAVKKVFSQPDLVKGIAFRPSIITRYESKYMLLNYSERAFLSDVINSRTLLPPPAGTRPQLVFDVASEYMLLVKAGNTGKLDEKDTAFYQSLAAASADKNALASIPGFITQPDLTNPLFSHNITTMLAGGGVREGRKFAEVALHPSLHEMQDPAPGYSPYSELKFFSTTLRYYEEEKLPFLHKFEIVRLKNLFPMGKKLYKPSKELGAAFLSRTTEKPDAPVDQLYFNLHFGYGVAYTPFLIPILDRFTFFLYAEAHGDVAPHFDSGWRASPAGFGGMIIRIGDLATFYANARYLYHWNQTQKDSLFLEVVQNIGILRDLALEAGFRRHFPDKAQEWYAIFKYFY